MRDLKSFARDYRETYGFNVIPLLYKSKVPALPEGRGLLYRWATDEEFEGFTFKGLGIVTGQTSGVVVLDIDNPTKADEWLGTIPRTPAVKTGRGTHYYFRHPGYELRTSNVPGGEVKGDGGYVIAPPSLHPSGIEYEWINGPNDTEIAELPDWLLEELRRRPERPSSIRPVEETIPEGTRNSTLFDHARSLFKRGYGEDEVSALLGTMNGVRCDPPIDEDELEKIVQSAGSDKYERGQLRTGKQVSSSLSLSVIDDSDSLEVRMMRDMKRPRGPRPFVVDGLVFKGFPAAIYGDGGTAKSTLVMHLAQCVARGEQWLGFDTVQTNVLYVDFELDEDEQSRRAYEIAQGMGYEELPEGCAYISGAGYKSRDVFDYALRFCREHGFGMVIVDSAGYALDGDAESSSDVLDFFKQCEGAFRRAGITMLLVDHQAKGGRTYQDRTMFGSVYKSNSARSVFQVEASERGDGYMNLTIRHKKVNLGAMLQPFGVSVRFVGNEYGEVEEVRLSRREMDATELAEEKSLTAADRVVNVLQDGPHFPAAISESTGLELRTVKNTLTKLRKAEAVEDTGNKDEHGSHEVQLRVSSSSFVPSDGDSDTYRKDRQLVAVG